MKQQHRRAGRPSLTDANGAVLFAAMGMACFAALRLALPREWSGVQAGLVWDALQGVLFVALAARLTLSLRPSAREKRLRMGLPTIAQTLFCALAICAGVLFTDDLTLLAGAFLQRLGLDVSRQIGALQPAPFSLYLLRAFCSGVLPGVAVVWLFHGALLSAWERRGTGHAVLIVSALGALMAGSIVLLPAQLVLLVAAGCVAVRTGSLMLSGFLCVGVRVLGVAAGHAQALSGVNAARYGRLWHELGGKQGALLLGAETLLLGLAFFCLIRAVCSAKPQDAPPWRMRQGPGVPMDAANVFVLGAAVTTALAVLFLDFLQMAGVF